MIKDSLKIQKFAYGTAFGEALKPALFLPRQAAVGATGYAAEQFAGMAKDPTATGTGKLVTSSIANILDSARRKM